MKKNYYLGFLLATLFIGILNSQASVKVTLHSDITGLEEATYGIYYKYNNELVTTIKTNYQNDVFYDLEVGHYIIKQIESKSGHLTDSNIYDFILSYADIKYRINLMPSKTYGTLNITSQTESKEQTKKEENITYEIYNSKNQLLTEITTDEEGLSKIILPTGVYQIKQKTEIPNTYKVEDIPVSIKVDTDTNITFHNQKIEVLLKINSLDLELNKPLLRKNIIYRIYHKNGGNICLNNLCHFSTDENGTLTFPFYLTKGEYKVRVLEISDLKNYLWNNQDYNFKVDENTPEEIELNIPHKRIKAHLNINLYDEILKISDNSYTYDLKENKERNLTIIAREDIQTGGHLFYKKGEIVTTIDMNNPKTLELELGHYTIISKGFKTDIDLLYKNSYNSFINETKEVIIPWSKGKLDINMPDYPNNKIKIYTEDNQLIYENYLNEEGKLTITNLFTGIFYLKLNDESFPFNITENNITKLDIPKKETSYEPEQPPIIDNQLEEDPPTPSDTIISENPSTLDFLSYYIISFTISLISIFKIKKKLLNNSF